jgi:hypothetical protein
MKLTRKGWFAMGVATFAVATVAMGAGNYSTYPIVGSPSFCGSNNAASSSVTGVTGQQGVPICVQTIPAGPPALTDEELIPADLGQSNNGPVQSVVIPSGMLGGLNLKVNRLVGGDFTTNLWQRGTTPLSAASPTTAAMAADRWWAISASNVVTITKQTPASTAADYLGNVGFYSVMRVARPSGTPSGATCVGQTLDQQAAAPLIGNNAVLSFRAYAPTTFSATNQQITVTIAYFTAADAAVGQTAVGQAGVNSKTFALSASGQTGGITGYVAATAGTSPGTTGTLASGVETIALTQTPTLYSVYAPIPSANAAGTAVTAVGIAFCATPTATSTVSTDYFELASVQLQSMPSAAANNLPAGLISPTGFERKAAVIEAANELYYSYVITEGALGPSRSICHFTTANSAMQCPIVFPIVMRKAPAVSYTAGFAGFTTTAETTASNCTALATDATVAFTSSTQQVMAQCTLSGTTAAVGLSMTLIDNGGAGVVSASAEP